MKKIIRMLLLLPALALAEPPEQANSALSSFQPLGVFLEEGKLTIVLNETKVTEGIYKTVIKALCGKIWMGHKDTLKGVNEIHVINQYQAKGYVFEGGTEACQEMGQLNDNKADFYILGITHLY